ncbi:MAG: LemA family protein [Candidatus Saccharimonas sp.]|nr:LemA family protein [Candidatus Saccharimonas sp.]
MKKPWTLVSIVAAVVIVFGMLLAASYNGLVTSRESVRGSINNLQSQYQRRADLVPNLVETVKGDANFEKSTLESVISARAKATQITIDPSKATPEQVQQYQEAQGELSQALGRLIAVSENYPELKATQAFQDLMTQLEGTENRIQVARADYGKTAQAYNAKIQRFPTNISAGIFGFDQFPYFTADKGAESVPKVDFNTTPTPTTEPQPAQ